MLIAVEYCYIRLRPVPTTSSRSTVCTSTHLLCLQYPFAHFFSLCNLLLFQNSKGYLSWLDVSVGTRVTGFQTHRGRLSLMAQNPTNAILHLGHSRGTVSLWSPNNKEPLVEMLCHNAAVRSICVDKTGK